VYLRFQLAHLSHAKSTSALFIFKLGEPVDKVSRGTQVVPGDVFHQLLNERRPATCYLMLNLLFAPGSTKITAGNKIFFWHPK
jgi:hypothetical protein